MPHEISAAPDTAARVQHGQGGRGICCRSFEELDDGEAEADQRDRGAHPRHHRAFDAEAGAEPAEMVSAVTLTSKRPGSVIA